MNEIRYRFSRARWTYFHGVRRAFLAMLVAAASVVVVAALPGCVWKPEILYVDPSFTSKELVTGKIAVMPVKFDTDKATPGERWKVVGGLIRAVRQLRSDIPMVTTPEHTRALQGALEDEAVFMRVYEHDGNRTDPNALAPLRESLGARYLILSRLHYEQAVAGGGSGMGNNTVESTLSGTVSILDTTSGRTVWAGTFSTTRGGIDDLVDPRPSVHALPFFSTFVKEWPNQH